ncbi:MAG: antibiotic biosynthesis monooxygenase [Firmicutes bacterium]|jgi:quinol monooxygenase YgiN|nr:antibiotic biosynthesis monooxygenase [Bacillota bacterium]MBR6503385.1 antibiotic biosynthesis monooxygenase [Bacillota bacterium]
MSITRIVYYTGSNGSARRFVRDMEESGAASLIRREDGNERYEYFLSAHDRETVMLVDQWRDQEALDEHEKALMKKDVLALRKEYGLTMRIERYYSELEYDDSRE